MANLTMVVRVLFLVVILMGITMLANWGGDPGLSNPVTWVHILAGLVAIGLIERLWASVRSRGALASRMMIVRGLVVLVILLGIAQLYDVGGQAGLGSPVTWIHILAGLGILALFESLWAARARA